MVDRLNRRGFIKHAAAVGGVVGLNGLCRAEPASKELERPKPIGEAKGIHPGRTVWVHDPRVTDWKAPGDGHWYDAQHAKQDHVDEMMSQAILGLTGQVSVAKAWDALFRHLNQMRGKGDVPYRAGEKLVIKPNWVGMIWREGMVDPATYTFMKWQDYMNTSPQMVIAVLRQLVGAAGHSGSRYFGVRLAGLPGPRVLRHPPRRFSRTSGMWTTPASSDESRSSPRSCPCIGAAGRKARRPITCPTASPKRNT